MTDKQPYWGTIQRGGNTGPAVALRQVGFRYRKSPDWALRGVSLDLEVGKFTLILGPSGCGKSTLAMTMDGLIPHVIKGEMEGRVLVEGLDTREHPVGVLAERVGLLFQDPESQLCTLTVEDEVAFGLENRCFPPALIEERIEEALTYVGLSPYRQTRLDRLSGGQKQRGALASILGFRPRTLVLDEPTSNLDPQGAVELMGLLHDLTQEGEHALAVIEHRLDDIISLVDEVVALSPEGQILARGAPRQIFDQEVNLLAQHGVWLPTAVEVKRRLEKRGLSLPGLPLTIEEAAQAVIGAGLLRQRTLSGAGGREGERRLQGASSPSPRGTAILVEDLSYAYPDGTIALRGINLAVEEGDFFALVGPNGSGKTTLALHLVGLIRPLAGQVRLFGQDVTALPPRMLTAQAGYVFQNPEHQFVAETVYDELAYGLRARGETESSIRRQVEEMLARFGLLGYAGRSPYRLSQGEKRRLSVATMLILGQRLLILDEPTFGQDSTYARELMAELHTLHEQGVTIIFITHDMSLVAEHARHVAVLREGQVAWSGPVKEVFNQADLLRDCALCPPPVLQLSQRLRREEPGFPPVATVEEFCEVFA